MAALQRPAWTRDPHARVGLDHLRLALADCALLLARLGRTCTGWRSANDPLNISIIMGSPDFASPDHAFGPVDVTMIEHWRVCGQPLNTCPIEVDSPHCPSCLSRPAEHDEQIPLCATRDLQMHRYSAMRTEVIMAPFLSQRGEGCWWHDTSAAALAA